MVLAGQVPAAIHEGLQAHADEVLEAPASSIELWAVHPGGRTIVDAVERAFDLPPAALSASREVLRALREHVIGNSHVRSGEAYTLLRRRMGCAVSFGPGLVVEAMRFRGAG